MIKRCCYCKDTYGKKEPLTDKRITDGICPVCFKRELTIINNKVVNHG